MLLFLREFGLGVGEGFQVGDGEAGREVEVKELLVELVVGSDDRYGDSRPGRDKEVGVSMSVAVTQDGCEGETAGRGGRTRELGV